MDRITIKLTEQGNVDCDSVQFGCSSNGNICIYKMITMNIENALNGFLNENKHFKG